MSKPETTVAYYTDTDKSWIMLLGSVGPGEIARTHWCDEGRIALNFDADGHLIGIELIDLDMLHPELARHAIQMRPVREGDF